MMESIELKEEKNIPPEKIRELFHLINWTEKTDLTLADHRDRSIFIVSAWDGETLVGMARSIKGPFNTAQIWDLSVRPEYQRKGIGTKILNKLLTLLDDYGIPVVTLYAEPSREDFYQKFGFEADDVRLLVMNRKKKINQEA